MFYKSYLLFCYLHVKHHKIQQFVYWLPDDVPKLWCLYQTMNELKNTENKILKSKHLSCKPKILFWCTYSTELDQLHLISKILVRLNKTMHGHIHHIISWVWSNCKPQKPCTHETHSSTFIHLYLDSGHLWKLIIPKRIYIK